MTSLEALKILADDRKFKGYLFYKALIEQGRQMERERIITILEKEYPAISTWRCWQALIGSTAPCPIYHYSGTKKR